MESLLAARHRVAARVAFDHLFSVATDQSGVWAVGSFGTTGATGGRGDHPLILRWNGTRWIAASTPPQQDSPLHWARLGGVSADGSGRVIAVGDAGSGNKQQPIVTEWTDRWTEDDVRMPRGTSFGDVATDPTARFTIAVGSRQRRGTGETMIEVCY